MENNVSSNNMGGIKVEEQFFGNVPKALEISYVSVCLGAPIQYRKDKITNLTQACMLVPTKNGVQPAMVTFKKEDSVGRGAYEAIYHQLGVEKLLKSSEGSLAMNNNEANNYLVETFQSRANLGKGNTYSSTILEPKFNTLGEQVKESYPENFSVFVNMRDDFTNKLKDLYLESTVEKKTMDTVVPPQTTTQTRVNV